MLFKERRSTRSLISRSCTLGIKRLNVDGESMGPQGQEAQARPCERCSFSLNSKYRVLFEILHFINLLYIALSLPIMVCAPFLT